MDIGLSLALVMGYVMAAAAAVVAGLMCNFALRWRRGYEQSNSLIAALTQARDFLDEQNLHDVMSDERCEVDDDLVAAHPIVLEICIAALEAASSRSQDGSPKQVWARAVAAEANDRLRKQGIITLFDAVRHAAQPMDGKQVAVVALCLQRLSLPTVSLKTVEQNDGDLLAVGLDSMPDIPDAAGVPGRRT